MLSGLSTNSKLILLFNFCKVMMDLCSGALSCRKGTPFEIFPRRFCTSFPRSFVSNDELKASSQLFPFFFPANHCTFNFFGRAGRTTLLPFFRLFFCFWIVVMYKYNSIQKVERTSFRTLPNRLASCHSESLLINSKHLGIYLVGT